MRIYSKLSEAVKETERELIEMGTRVIVQSMQDKEGIFDTIELQGYGYIITNHAGIEEDFIKLGGNVEYLRQELQERVSPLWYNPGQAWSIREDTWSQFLEPSGKFAYTYNERFREQLMPLLKELNDKPSTRQAILSMYDRHQDMNNWGGKRRIPCSMYYQFLRRIRNGIEVLDIIYTMRSCDIYNHYLYDVVLAMKLQEYVANALGIEPGHFTHFIGSLHAYKKDADKKGVF